jgi:hypothetical protein
MIRKSRLEISDKIVDGPGKCFILVLYFIVPYNKISLYYSSDMEGSDSEFEVIVQDGTSFAIIWSDGSLYTQDLCW